jgi:hypothetical protein
MKRYIWKDEASCLGLDTNLFFEKYEDEPSLRHGVDNICKECPIRNKCFAVGITGKEWGVWGGIYLENGEVSREFNKHKTKQDWGDAWTALTME